MTLAERKRHFDNGVAGLINSLHHVKNNNTMTYAEKLKLVTEIEKTFPAMRQALIFFINYKGDK